MLIFLSEVEIYYELRVPVYKLSTQTGKNYFCNFNDNLR